MPLLSGVTLNRYRPAHGRHGDVVFLVNACAALAIEAAELIAIVAILSKPKSSLLLRRASMAPSRISATCTWRSSREITSCDISSTMPFRRHDALLLGRLG